MTIQKFIEVSFEWAAVHRWPDAPESHEYLSLPHRHQFHCYATMEVHHTDREVEFIKVKELLQSEAGSSFEGSETTMSCEHMANLILSILQEAYGTDRQTRVTVMEDDENGGTVVWNPETTSEEVARSPMWGDPPSSTRQEKLSSTEDKTTDPPGRTRPAGPDSHQPPPA